MSERLNPTAALLATAFALASCTACAPTFEPPGIEDWQGEPQVAARIRVARARVLAEPSSAQAVGGLGMIFHAHELHSEAVACYDRAIALAATEARWPYLAAVATAKTDLEGSTAYFERAARLDDANAAVHIGHGDTLARLGRMEQAAEQYRRALELEPASSHALYGLAQTAFAAGEIETAAAQLERAAASAPQHGEVHGLLANAYRRLGRTAEAERELLRAGAFPDPTRAADPFLAEVRAKAVNSRAISERGQRFARGGRFVEAEEAFRQVLEIRPGNSRDYSNLGGALTGQGRLDEAIAAYRQALEIDPEDAFALNNLGLALAEGGDVAGAVARLEQAAALDPAYTDPRRNLGLLRARQGRHDEAIEHYRRALGANPSAVQVHNDLGTSLAALGELEQAVEHWQWVLDIDASELAALYNLSTAHVLLGQHSKAVRRLRRGLEIAPNSSRLVSLLAWELATAPEVALRDAGEAERLARRVIEAQPGRPQPADILAAALAAQGRFEEAVSLASRAQQLARQAGQPGLVAQIGHRLDLYGRGRAFVQDGTGPGPVPPG